MRAITIQQPWAWAIMRGGKDVENRTNLPMWRAAAGQRIAVHAGQRWNSEGESDWRVGREFASTLGVSGEVPPCRDDQDFVLGAVLGTVYVVDVHWADDCWGPRGHCSGWADDGGDGRRVCHLQLRDPHALAVPVSCSGTQGLWHVPADVEAAVLAARAA